MFKKLKKNLVKKNKKIIEQSFNKVIKDSKTIRDNIEDKSQTTFRSLKRISLNRLNSLGDEIKDKKVLDAVDKGHSKAIEYLAKNSKNVNKAQITYIINQATEIANRETIIILEKEERKINRIRYVSCALIVLGSFVYLMR